MSEHKTTEERKKLIAQGLQKKKDCENTASQIVETLIENVDDVEWIQDALNRISQGHFDDITVERAVMKNCGYILCQKTLSNIPKQTFKIYSKAKRVLDLSERKNFCSESCFLKAGNLKDQIPTSPLWLREDKDRVLFRLNDRPSFVKNSQTEPIIEPKPSETKQKQSFKDKPKVKTIKKEKVVTPKDTFETLETCFKQWWTPQSNNVLRGKEPLHDDEDSRLLQEKIANLKLDEDAWQMMEVLYRGYIDPVHIDNNIKEKNSMPSAEPVLPTIDSKSQAALRRKIFLQNVEKRYGEFF